jgi:fatty acid desaturase
VLLVSATVPAKAGLMRESEGVLPNTLALGYAVCGYLGGFALMAATAWWANVAGVLLATHAMLIAAYLIHEAAHYTLFARTEHNRLAGELMSFIAGGAYVSFERIRHLHLRHHRDRADVTCFDYKAFLRKRRGLRRLVYALEWAHLPAVETLMHVQVILRPLLVQSQRPYLPRALLMLAVRVGLLSLLAWFSVKAALLYFVAYGLLLATLDFFDAFHHTFEQYFTDADAPVPLGDRDRNYEQANTYSNVVSASHPWLNLLTLNFGYHNAHHERASVPWYRLPALHNELFGGSKRELMSVAEVLHSFHRNRLKRVLDDDYGSVGEGPDRADRYIGAHGVSFLTVV